jgi:hypothetical protein
MGKYINGADEFKKGQYSGESVFEVADIDPEYITGLLDGNKLDEDERELLEQSIGRGE